MTPLRVQNGLLYVTVSLFYQGRELILPNVILDTGSAGTIFPTDAVATIDLNTNPPTAFGKYTASAVRSLFSPSG